MNERPYRVHVVVDPRYGERLRGLPVDEPAWVVDSKCNHAVIRTLWQEHKTMDTFTEITSFKFNPHGTPEDWFVSHLSIIDLHHGEFSHDPPYSILNVIGVQWSDRIQEELGEFGFDRHEPTAEGFVATRELDQESTGA